MELVPDWDRLVRVVRCDVTSREGRKGWCNVSWYSAVMCRVHFDWFRKLEGFWCFGRLFRLFDTLR